MKKPTPLFILSLSATLLMIGVGMIVALLPQQVHAMTGSLESVGLIASVFAFTYLLAQLPISVLSDRLGAKRFLVIGYLLCAASGVVFFYTMVFPHRSGPPLCLGKRRIHDGQQATKAGRDCHEVTAG